MEGFYKEVIEIIKKEKPDKDKLSKLKVKLCNNYKMKRIPSDFDILLNASQADLNLIKKCIQSKPTRSLSGVNVVAIMTKPIKCPHGKCIMCPGGPDSFFGDTPQSYTGKEPATRRAIRNDFDPYLQVFNRLEQYTVLGHPVEKTELIIMGGTFPSFPIEYQDEFLGYAVKALNDFSKLFLKGKEVDIEKFKEFFELPGDIYDDKRQERVKSKIKKLKGKLDFEKELKENEKARIRKVALCLETRPDYCNDKEIKQMIKLGVTRVELGVQSLDDKVLKKIQRGHSVQDTIDSTKRLKDAYIKVGYHMMIGLPGSSTKKDINQFKELFSNENFKPDFLKIYPCLITEGTELFKIWKSGKFKPLTIDQAEKIIIDGKKFVPKYCRIMRVQRDIPTTVLKAGALMSNLRQDIQNKKDFKCNCIRCREYGTKLKQKEKIETDIDIVIYEYEASNGFEFFISAENVKTNTLFGFCRLRLDKNAGIRQLHVVGFQVEIGKEGSIQHKGLGKQLLEIAETIAKQNKRKKMFITSGIGVREYYKKFGYKLKDHYMVKVLN
jgi:elongator complex protein 3